MHSEYILKRRKGQKRVNMIVEHDGTLVVTAPRFVPRTVIERVLKKHAVWISAQQKKKRHHVTIDDVVVGHMKNIGKKIVTEKLEHYNKHYQFDYTRISMRMQKTRWGSCSSRGTLSFNCKIVALSEELRDYIVVHELCHLKEMNHSPRFWQLVAQTLPDYKERRRKLKAIMI